MERRNGKILVGYLKVCFVKHKNPKSIKVNIVKDHEIADVLILSINQNQKKSAKKIEDLLRNIHKDSGGILNKDGWEIPKPGQKSFCYD